MKKIAIFWEERFNNNNFYNLNIDQNLKPYYELAKLNWLENSISFNLLVWRSDKKEYIILCFKNFFLNSIIDYIKLFYKYPKNKKYLFIFEPKVISVLNWFKLFHIFFDRVYTRNDNYVDNKKYFKFIYPSTDNWIRYNKKFNNKKLITLINWNKASFFKNELYSEREKAIRFFEKNNVEFDLYWTNWDKKNLKQKLFWYKVYKSYKWKVYNKLETLSNYKFNICFENMKNTPWYITEKIFDSFKANSVPIYWWASNINQYVPEWCFIDFERFNWDYNELIEYLININEDKYNEYINNINIFMNSVDAKKWFDKDWAINFINNL